MHSFHTVLRGPRTCEKSTATTRAGLSRGPGCAETTHARLKRNVGMEIDAIFMGGTRRQNVARPLRIPSLVPGIRSEQLHVVSQIPIFEGSSRLTFLACYAHYPGGPTGADGYSIARSRAGFFPVGSAFPALAPGRRPHCSFRGLLKLHTRYGLQGRSPT